MGLEIHTKINTTWEISQQAAVVPPWYSTNWNIFTENVQNVNKWYKSGTIDFFYNQINNNNESSELYVQYGQDISAYAAARFFSETLKIENQVNNGDGSIDADITLQNGYIGGSKTTHATHGWACHATLDLLGQRILDYTGNTIDTYFTGKIVTAKQHIHLAPKEESDNLLMTFNVHYPNGESGDATLTFGLVIVNNNPNNYRPNAVRIGDKWLDNNSNKFDIKCRIGGQWEDFSTEQATTAEQPNHGHNRIRSKQQFLQASKMQGGTSV